MEGFLEKYLEIESFFENKICVLEHHSSMPTKCSDAQRLFKYEIQLPYEKIKKSGKVMQLPMDSYFCGINTSFERILTMSFLLFA